MEKRLKPSSDITRAEYHSQSATSDASDHTTQKRKIPETGCLPKDGQKIQGYFQDFQDK